MITVDEIMELDECPCELCASQDDEVKILEREKLKELDEVCDLLSNEIIDLIIKNPKKYLLKNKKKENKLE